MFYKSPNGLTACNEHGGWKRDVKINRSDMRTPSVVFNISYQLYGAANRPRITDISDGIANIQSVVDNLHSKKHKHPGT